MGMRPPPPLQTPALQALLQPHMPHSASPERQSVWGGGLPRFLRSISWRLCDLGLTTPSHLAVDVALPCNLNVAGRFHKSAGLRVCTPVPSVYYGEKLVPSVYYGRNGGNNTWRGTALASNHASERAEVHRIGQHVHPLALDLRDHCRRRVVAPAPQPLPRQRLPVPGPAHSDKSA